MQSSSQQSFYGLGLAPDFLKRLEALEFHHPTPIQHKAIPIGIAGDDMIGIAQTGTGKTLAFTLPMLQRLAVTKKMGLVLCPTRELAIQVNETMEKVGGPFGLKTAVIIGGDNMARQIRALKQKTNVIIATPGRLIDHLQQRTVRLDQVGVLVLDEADRMLDMGFEPSIRRILGQIPEERQTMLFSATMPPEIAKIAHQYMKSPLKVEVAPAGTTTELVDQELFVVPKSQKTELLLQLLDQYRGTVLVFTRTKFGAKKLTKVVNDKGHRAAEIHSNRTLSQRRHALDGFKSGKYRILIATDIAARGIDVQEIELVINYDLPENSEDYVHRIGRTGRAGNMGKAISFACPDQGNDVSSIERLIKISLPIQPLPALKTPVPASELTQTPRPTQRSGFGSRRTFQQRRRR